MKTFRHYAVWGLLATSLLLSAWQGWLWYLRQSQNAWIAALAHGRDIGAERIVGAAPEVYLARAAYLRQHQRYDEALEALNAIVGLHGGRLQAKIRYNLGNVYLAQALQEIDAERLNQALPLLQLAKQAYRQALKLDSGFWDAKYNLELAMGLLPELDRIVQAQPDDDAAQPAPLWTTVPGFPRGLP